MAINVFPAEKRAKGTIGGYWDTPLSVQNAGKDLKSPKRGLRGTVYCCYTVPLAYLLSAAWTPATERSVYGQSCPEGLEDRSNQPRKEKAMEALRRSQRHRVPPGVEMPDRRCGPAGNGPRAEADGRALGVVQRHANLDPRCLTGKGMSKLQRSIAVAIEGDNHAIACVCV